MATQIFLGCPDIATLKFPEMPTEVETLKRIHLNYRLQYLKDVHGVFVPLGKVALSNYLGYCSATGPR